MGHRQVFVAGAVSRRGRRFPLHYTLVEQNRTPSITLRSGRADTLDAQNREREH
jgi:hypothetical protein